MKTCLVPATNSRACVTLWHNGAFITCRSPTGIIKFRKRRTVTV